MNPILKVEQKKLSHEGDQQDRQKQLQPHQSDQGKKVPKIEQQMMGINFGTKINENYEPISNQQLNGDRKKPPIVLQQDINKLKMDVEIPNNKRMGFFDLPDQIRFYLVDIYLQNSNNRLYLTGMLQNSQTINIVANQNYKDLYFCLKNETLNSNTHSEGFLEKAKEEIDLKLKYAGIKVEYSAFQKKQYVFQIAQIPRGKRLYYRVRYSFKTETKDPPKPDWEGRFFKYVFGTTYTPLQIFIMNSQIKGPSWVQINKIFVTEKTPRSDLGLTLQIINPQQIQLAQQNKRPPSMRVMSLSIKTAIPSQVRLKKLFPTNKIDQPHIFAISYHFCDSYLVDSKPPKPQLITKTFYLKQFLQKPVSKDQVTCQNQKDMFKQFLQDLRHHDPDFIVCHDSSLIIDNLIQRMGILQKENIPRLGRFTLISYLNKSNQSQRINSCLVGRLLVDTFLHCRSMIKDVDYGLQSMSKQIKPDKKFVEIKEDEMLELLSNGKTLSVINKCREQSQCTFDLMNHLEVIQMARSLSNICGNTWKKNLQLQRSEGNQYLLIHECIKNELIVPDKYKVGNGEESEQINHKKYTGGLVLNPEIGMYNDFILLLDFNSLYPSLIRQYNICFSVIDRPKLPFSYYYKAKDYKKKQKTINQEEMGEENQQQFQVKPPLPEECTKQKWGFLPQVIDKIVQRRKKCKQEMKKAPLEKIVILDIQQKCYKVVANSIYGCLGFKFNRFFSKHLAALVTRMGRQALIRAKQMVNARGSFRVIYGDTDSLMLQPTSLNSQTNLDKILELKTMANDLKKQINKEYKNLQIDVDGVYKPLILLQKKKYVANKLKNYEEVIFTKAQPQFAIQYKGVQVVRRDICLIARIVLEDVIKILMNPEKADDKEKLLNEVVEYFIQINKNLPTMGEKDFKKFLLAKVLSKKPKEYTGGENQSHVKVAVDRLRNGEKQETLVGHYIYYLICEPQNQTQDSYAKRSWDDKTFEKSQKSNNPAEKLKIDLKYYKIQILKPVSRILKTVGISMDRICDQMKVQKMEKDKLKRFVEEDQEEIQGANQGNILQLVMNRDLSSKIFKLEEEVGNYKCCDTVQSLMIDSRYRTHCQKCKKQLLIRLYNKIMFMIKKKLCDYYKPGFKCKCSKQYILTPISACCKIVYQQKSTIPHNIHDMLYLCKDTCDKTLKVLKQKDSIERIKQINELIQNFLNVSEYENVGNLLSKMQF